MPLRYPRAHEKGEKSQNQHDRYDDDCGRFIFKYVGNNLLK